MQDQKIPATVITGFLGAGKTSLIRHALGEANGRRIALIINEFGDLGIDQDVLQGCGDEACDETDIVELANGCICCTVADDFVPAIEALLAREPAPEHILIETSGLALPKPLVAAFNWPEIRTRLTVDGVVAVVDGPALAEGRFADDEDALQAQREADEMLDHESPLAEVFEDQIGCADMVILNKSDLLAANGAEEGAARMQPHSAARGAHRQGGARPRAARPPARPGGERRSRSREPPLTPRRPRRAPRPRRVRELRDGARHRRRPGRLRGAAERGRGGSTVSSAPRDSSMWPAAGGGSWCRRWAPASTATSTVTGTPARRGRADWW